MNLQSKMDSASVQEEMAKVREQIEKEEEEKKKKDEPGPAARAVTGPEVQSG